MFSYILSFFRSSEPELSIEDATKILTQDNEPFEAHFGNETENVLKRQEKLSKEQCNFATTTGTITGIKEDKYVIDNVYEFEPESQNFQIGDTVAFQKLISEGNIIIYNVSRIIGDWDTTEKRESILSTRVMICKVEKREKRILILTPGEIKVNLDKISIEFIPLVGDWLEIDVKYEVNENSLDLSGEVIEVNRISPLRPHIEEGQISFWDPLERSGQINRNIYFNRDSLSFGYIPIIGDKVVTEVIESEQNRCTWRALKVLPINMRGKFQTPQGSNQVKMEESHFGLEISDTYLHFRKLGENKKFSISLTNNLTDNLKFVNAEISQNPSQVILCEGNSKNKVISPGETLVLALSCTPKNMGSSNEFIIFKFEDFTVGKYINIDVNPNISGELYQKNYHPKYENIYQGRVQVIRGQKINSARFQAAKVPDYPVPKKLLDVVIKYEIKDRDKVGLFEELKIIKRCLLDNLDSLNYEDKFHTLLHLDEIANLIAIRQYDQERVCFIPNGEFLMLEIENLAERRPGIVLGDRIIASDPTNISQEHFEGNVFKVGAKHVYLKFSGMFHEHYKGEDYSIKVIPGRSSYKRQHHAIHLAARNLGRNWLFPTKVTEKAPQLHFDYDPYPKTITLNADNAQSPPKPNRITSLMKKLKESNLQKGTELGKTNDRKEREPNRSATALVNGKEKELEFDSDRKSSTVGNIEDNPGDSNTKKLLKLEWYNTNLNCKQKDAVINILNGVSRPLPYIVFGPPGTGKTVTVIEAVLQIVRLIPESRILVTAPSNSAADLIALRLVGYGVLKPGDLIRLVSVNYAVGEHIPAKLIPFCATGSLAREGTAEDNVVNQKGLIYDCSRSVLGRHKITVSTCSSAGTLHMMGFPRGHFTHIFVDEAGQAGEPEVLIPISFLDKYDGQVILAGDPMQLGPVILCKIANECGLNESFLERLINRFPYVRDIEGFPDTEGFDPRLVTKLLYNYRNLSVILKLFSLLFYNDDLIPTISNTNSPESRLLNSLSSILPQTNDDGVPSIVFHGVEGENYQTADSPSWYNPHEAAQVFYYVNEFYRLGMKDQNIGIITPYTKQVREIRQLFREAEFSLPKIGTIEDFQGQEFDVILLSTVRSSRDYIPCDLEHSLGFVSSPRRLNVAISRAKALLVIIGNPALLCYDTYWRTVINYCMEHGAYTGCHFSSS